MVLCDDITYLLVIVEESSMNLFCNCFFRKNRYDIFVHTKISDAYILGNVKRIKINLCIKNVIKIHTYFNKQRNRI